jgi:hypothetical protein
MRSLRILGIALLPIIALATVMITPHRPYITMDKNHHLHLASKLAEVHAQYTQGAQWQTNDNIAELDLGTVNGCQAFLTTGAFAAGPANAGAFAGPTFARAAANNYVWQATTSAAASALTIDCDLGAPFTRTTPGKGVIITGAAIMYGNQTSALTSVTLPTVATIAYPQAGGTASGTVASAGGVITTTPAIGSAILTTTTTGQCNNLFVALATPVSMNLQNQRLTMETVLNQTVAAATTYQLCGVSVFYQNVVF